MSLQVALVGTGFALHTQLPAFRRVAGAEVSDLVGRDPERTRRLAAVHGIPRWSVDLDAVLRRSEVQLVCISTPPDLHRAMAEAALRAGKHVLCEKPMALDTTEATSMLRVAAEAPGLACIDHQLRFAPNLVRCRRLLADGYLGHALHAELTLRVGSRLDPRRAHDWWSEARRGGGALGALGSHAIDLLRWLFGEVRGVCGELSTFFRERHRPGELRPSWVDSDDFAAFLLRFAKDATPRASVVVSTVAHRSAGLRLELYGSDGLLRLDEQGRLWGSRRDPGARHAVEQPPLEELSQRDTLTEADLRAVPDTLFGRAFLYLARELTGALTRAQPLPQAANFADGLAVQRVLDAVRTAARERRWVELRTP